MADFSTVVLNTFPQCMLGHALITCLSQGMPYTLLIQVYCAKTFPAAYG